MSSAASRVVPVDLLPEELLVDIFSWLQCDKNSTGLNNVLLVCRKWFKLCLSCAHKLFPSLELTGTKSSDFYIKKILLIQSHATLLEKNADTEKLKKLFSQKKLPAPSESGLSSSPTDKQNGTTTFTIKKRESVVFPLKSSLLRYSQLRSLTIDNAKLVLSQPHTQLQVKYEATSPGTPTSSPKHNKSKSSTSPSVSTANIDKYTLTEEILVLLCQNLRMNTCLTSFELKYFLPLLIQQQQNYFDHQSQRWAMIMQKPISSPTSSATSPTVLSPVASPRQDESATTTTAPSSASASSSSTTPSLSLPPINLSNVSPLAQAIANSLPYLTSLKLLVMTLSDDDVGMIVQKLPKLRNLNLWACPLLTINSIKHICYQTFSNQLQELHIGAFRIAIFDDSLQEISKCLPNLQILNLSRCDACTDLGVQYLLKNLTQLTTLDLSFCCKVSEAIVPYLVQRSSTLKSINLRRCTFSKVDNSKTLLSQISQLANLTYLNLSETTTGNEDMSIILSSCKKLEELILSRCTRLTDVGLQLSGISEYPSLHTLKLDEVDSLSDSYVLEELVKFTNIKHLQMTIPRISKKAFMEGFTKLKKLRHLHLTYALRLDDEVFQSLAGSLKSLRHLALNKTQALTADGLKQGLPKLTKLKGLEFSYCSASLQEQHLQNNVLQWAPQLETLKFNNTNIALTRK